MYYCVSLCISVCHCTLLFVWESCLVVPASCRSPSCAPDPKIVTGNNPPTLPRWFYSFLKCIWLHFAFWPTFVFLTFPMATQTLPSWSIASCFLHFVSADTYSPPSLHSWSTDFHWQPQHSQMIAEVCHWTAFYYIVLNCDTINSGQVPKFSLPYKMFYRIAPYWIWSASRQDNQSAFWEHLHSQLLGKVKKGEKLFCLV